MDLPDLPSFDVSVETITAETLRSRIDGGDPVTILDTRAGSNYDDWHIDGENVSSINVPYFDFLDDDVGDDVLAPIPTDEEVVVTCAKGHSSEFVAEKLVDMCYDAVHMRDGMEGWARLYDAVEVTRYDGSGALYQYQRPSSGCLGYLLVSDGEAAVIDPLRAFTDRYHADVEQFGATLRYAIDTHVHADHVSGVRELAAGDGVEGILPEPTLDRGLAYADEITTVVDGETITVGDTAVEVVHTPGHTSGMTSYLIDESFLATGDGLFVDSVARPDLEAGEDGAADAAETLYETLQKTVLTLPDETLVGGGHVGGDADPAADGTYTAPLAELVEAMDALRLDREAFVELVLADMPPRPANYEENLGTQNVDDETAFTLELGPNNCAASSESLAGD
ncbi:MAG: MBL fold metallo-hydrolase [Halobaculum sp.]